MVFFFFFFSSRRRHTRWALVTGVQTCALPISGVLGPELIGRLYGVAPADVLFTPDPAGLAFKATIPRAIPAGDLGDTDVYGCQQHAPLLDVDIPVNEWPDAGA